MRHPVLFSALALDLIIWFTVAHFNCLHLSSDSRVMQNKKIIHMIINLSTSGIHNLKLKKKSQNLTFSWIFFWIFLGNFFLYIPRKIQRRPGKKILSRIFAIFSDHICKKIFYCQILICSLKKFYDNQ